MVLKIFLICVVILAKCICVDKVDSQYTYDDFRRQNGKIVKGLQKDNRQQIFDKNYAEIIKENEKGANLIPNKFIDWIQDEKTAYFNFHPQKYNISYSNLALSSKLLFAPPRRFDWRTYDRVTPIRDQKTCGACWAFAATAQYQSMITITTNGTKYDLSQQYLIQCTSTSYGCNGGVSKKALELANRTGMPLESKYPYVSPTNYTKSVICAQTNTTKTGYSATVINRANQTADLLQQYLVSYGPVVVSLGVATCNSFMYAGPYTNISCPNNSRIDHVALLVGYDQTRWIIKNSWGTWWGNGGYGYINKSSHANIHSFVDILQANISWNPVPPTPTPPAGSIVVTVTLTDSYGDGWNGNVLGFRQNGTIVGTFGANFLSGAYYIPINITLRGNVQTQIVVSQLGNFTNEVGFIVRAPNGTVIINRTSGSQFSRQAVFLNFCPAGGCPVTNLITLYLTLTDTTGDGWNGNVLAFRQNGTRQTFNLTSGRVAGPLVFNFARNVSVDVIVNTLGNKSNQCGFVLRRASGAVVIQRKSGTVFLANTIFGSFNPGLINLSPRQIVDANYLYSQTDIKQAYDMKQITETLYPFKIATFILASLLLITIIALILAIVKIMKLSKENNQKIPIEIQSGKETISNLDPSWKNINI